MCPAATGVTHQIGALANSRHSHSFTDTVLESFVGRTHIVYAAIAA